MKEAALEKPEVHAPHGRHGGLPRWLELVIAVTALITSISSIAIAVHHGRIMEQLVEANSVPYLTGGFSDILPEGDRVLSFDLLNRGVGPAHERSLRITVDGRYVRSTRELIRASLGPELAAAAELALAQGRWNARYCYCSVFDDCWEVLGKWEEPKPVAACVRDEPNEFMP